MAEPARIGMKDPETGGGGALRLPERGVSEYLDRRGCERLCLGGVDVKRAMQQLDALAHFEESDARREVQIILEIEVHAFAAIGDFEADAGALANQANGGPGTAGMAMNIGQTFLHDAKEDQFVFGGKGAGGFGDVEVDGNFAAFGKTGDVPLEGGAEIAGFQRRRMEKVGKRANLSHDLAVDVGAIVDRLTHGIGEARIFANELTEEHLQAGQILGEGFV